MLKKKKYFFLTFFLLYICSVINKQIEVTKIMKKVQELKDN